MPYRILMIAPTSFFMDYGAHVRILEEALILQKFSHQVCIVTYRNGRDLPGLHIERTLPIPWRMNYEVGSSRHKLAFDVLLALKTLQVARKFKPDIIHAHIHEGALIGAFVSQLLHLPLVFDFQGSMTSEMVDHGFLNPRGPFYRPLRWLEGKIDRAPHAILTSSENAARVLANDFAVPARKITTISDCVNPDAFTPIWHDGERARQIAELKQFVGIPRKRPVVVYLGLLAPYQGTDVLLEAASILVQRGVNVHFLIMGFPSVERYALLARRLGIEHRAAFPGRVPYDAAPLWLSMGNLAVAPKMSATEGSGKILNYMAMGLPVVAFDNPVAREYLGDLGVYAPLGDARAFADQIESLLSDPLRARALGEGLRARVVERFSWERAGREIEQVYKQVLERVDREGEKW